MSKVEKFREWLLGALPAGDRVGVESSMDPHEWVRKLEERRDINSLERRQRENKLRQIEDAIEEYQSEINGARKGSSSERIILARLEELDGDRKQLVRNIARYSKNIKGLGSLIADVEQWIAAEHLGYDAEQWDELKQRTAEESQKAREGDLMIDEDRFDSIEEASADEKHLDKLRDKWRRNEPGNSEGGPRGKNPPEVE